MSVNFQLPELGENIHSGDVVNVLVQEGQTIHSNQGVVELETDKAVVELPCPHAGKVTKVLVKKGDTVRVGQTLLVLEPEAARTPAEAKPATAAKAAAVEKPQAAPQPAAPVLPPVSTTVASKARAAAKPTGPIPAGPAARRLARELGVDIAGVQGSGARGRITPEDVRAATSGAPAIAAAAAGAAAVAPVVPPGEPGQDAWGKVRREKMSRIRKTIAAQMVHSAGTIPHVTNFDDADVTDLEALRKSVPPGSLGESLKLTMMPFLLKAVATALRRHPMLNASLDEQNDQIVYKEYVNLGVAVDTPRGLVVPVIRGADGLSVPQLARAVAAVAEKARAVQFGVEDLRGGTFTISNMGAVGGAYSTPIINHPEVALLLVGRSRWLPAVREGRIEPRFMMPLSLSYDHRLVDGAAAARFLNDVIDLLQSPGRLLLAN